MKKLYSQPELEIVNLNCDVICTSQQSDEGLWMNTWNDFIK